MGDSCLGPIGYSGLHGGGLVPAMSLWVVPQASVTERRVNSYYTVVTNISK